MNNLQRDFLRQSIFDLENLSDELREEVFPKDFLRDAFRLIHTIKGTTQTFGFSEPAHLAHELENLLQAARENKTAADENLKSLLREGFASLTENLRAAGESGDGSSSKDFVEKIREITAVEPSPKNFSPLELPPDVLSHLSQREKNSISAAIENDLNLFLIEVGFDFAAFETDFKKFRSVLDDAGEVIAAFPSRKFIPARAGFQFFLTTPEDQDHTAKIIAPFAAEIIYQIERRQTISAVENLEEMRRQASDGARKLAERFGRKVAFDASFDLSAEISVRRVKLIFDIILHLTRNAIDHAFEKSGKIEVVLQKEKNGLRLVFSDDGRGIDAEKIRAKAIEKNLVSAEKNLTEAEMLDLIFLPEVTTAKDVTDISGRGVGLDAVRNMAENSGGAISVKSVKDAGTTFEIFLPDEK